MIHKKALPTLLAILLVVSSFVVLGYYFLSSIQNEKEEFYVGVAFCGNTTQEAKLLIDKVKD